MVENPSPDHTPHPEGPQKGGTFRRVRQVVWLLVQLAVIVIGTTYLLDLYTVRRRTFDVVQPTAAPNQWHTFDGQQYQFLDINAVATEKRDGHIWVHEHLLNDVFHPNGVLRFNEMIYAIPPSLPVISMHCEQGEFCKDNPMEITLPVAAGEDVREAWFYGCSAAWGGLNRDEPFSYLEFLYDSNQSLSIPHNGPDIWLTDRHRYLEDSQTALAYAGTKISFEERRIDLDPSLGRLQAIRIRDTGTPPSNFFMGITLVRP